MVEKAIESRQINGIKNELLGKAAAHLADTYINESYLPFFQKIFALDDSMVDYGQLSDAIDNGYSLLLLANHQSHSDAFAMFFASQKIHKNTQLHSTRVIGALTMKTGHQGKPIQEFTARTEPLFAKHGVQMMGVLRPTDREKYSINDSELIKTSTKNVIQTVQARRENAASAIFLEGSVQAGRFRSPFDLRRNGMITPDDSTKELMTKMFKKKVIVEPVAINGSYHVFSPNTKFVTPKFLKSLHDWQHAGHTEPLAHVVMGTPFTSDMLAEEGVDLTNPDELTNSLMTIIAQYVDPPMQGVYML